MVLFKLESKIDVIPVLYFAGKLNSGVVIGNQCPTLVLKNGYHGIGKVSE